jgi:hypothetical protein
MRAASPRAYPTNIVNVTQLFKRGGTGTAVRQVPERAIGLGPGFGLGQTDIAQPAIVEPGERAALAPDAIGALSQAMGAKPVRRWVWCASVVMVSLLW